MIKSAEWLGGNGRDTDQKFAVLMAMFHGNTGFLLHPNGGVNFWRDSSDKEQWLAFNSLLTPGITPAEVRISPMVYNKPEWVLPGTAVGLNGLAPGRVWPWGLFDPANATYAYIWADRACEHADWLNREFGANVTGIMADSINADMRWWGQDIKVPTGYDQTAFRAAMLTWVVGVKKRCAERNYKFGGNVAYLVDDDWPEMWDILDVVMREDRTVEHPPDAHIADPARKCVAAVHCKAVPGAMVDGKQIPVKQQLRLLVGMYKSIMRDGDLLVTHMMKGESEPLV